MLSASNRSVCRVISLSTFEKHAVVVAYSRIKRKEKKVFRLVLQCSKDPVTSGVGAGAGVDAGADVSEVR